MSWLWYVSVWYSSTLTIFYHCSLLLSDAINISGCHMLENSDQCAFKSGVPSKLTDWWPDWSNTQSRSNTVQIQKARGASPLVCLSSQYALISEKAGQSSGYKWIKWHCCKKYQKEFYSFSLNGQICDLKRRFLTSINATQSLGSTKNWDNIHWIIF